MKNRRVLDLNLGNILKTCHPMLVTQPSRPEVMTPPRDLKGFNCLIIDYDSRLK